MKLKSTEKETQKAIIEFLNYYGHFVWRNNTGGFYTNHGQRFVRFGLQGSSDILGVSRDGRFIAIEVKSPGKKPLRHQIAFLDEVKRRGGIALVAYSLDDVTKLFSC